MNIVLDYKNDSKKDIQKKKLLFEIYNMKILKENNLWWDDSEKTFKQKYGVSSCHNSVEKVYNSLKKIFLK